MIFIILCFFVHWTKVSSASDMLNMCVALADVTDVAELLVQLAEKYRPPYMNRFQVVDYRLLGGCL